MKIKNYFWLTALLIALSTMILPVTAEAGCRCGGKGGVIYSNVDGKYYPVDGAVRCGAGRCMVYSAVDYTYTPVAKYGYCCHVNSRGNRVCSTHPLLSVQCQTRPAHWWQSVWIPESRECRYVRVVR